MTVQKLFKEVNRTIERGVKNPELIVIKAPGSRSVVLSKHGVLTKAGEQAKTLGWQEPVERILPSARPFMKGTKEYAPLADGRLVVTRNWQKKPVDTLALGPEALWCFKDRIDCECAGHH